MRRRLSCTFGERAHRHPCSRWHRDLVLAYRAERARQEDQLELVSRGYATDAAMHLERAGQLVTFREWLLAHAGGGAW